MRITKNRARTIREGLALGRAVGSQSNVSYPYPFAEVGTRDLFRRSFARGYLAGLADSATWFLKAKPSGTR